MSLVTTILSFFLQYTPLLSFLGAIIGGEETLILLSILASQGHLLVWTVFIFFYMGIITSDLLWYFIGRTKLFDWMIKRKYISKVYLRWDKLLNRATKGNNFQALLITKFLYGLRLPTIMYLARERMHFKSFLFYTIIVNFIWTSIIMMIGWSAGKGISLATDLSNNLILYLVLIGITMLVFTLLIKFLSKITKKWLIKTQKQLN
ncbi:hypothetical protein COY27_06600 [Candidatus Woesearchaeota archaeon CG_4_10_14_0_2_um_filter_33_13]|nr:MAG: hypothetical protein COY27_06600 [Candidatus Woesearchaeota archaeon CG_4_10_14_0_2_um_filter_33_13]